MNPFDFTAAVRTLCVDITERLPDFAHVDMTRVGVGFSQARHNEKYGVYASVTPLRDLGGKRAVLKNNTWFLKPKVFSGGTELLYILTVCLPRFQNQSLQDKIQTIVHELYHIGQNFDGDVRRFPGRCYAHGSSQKNYDKIVAALAEKWLAKDPPPQLWEFLKYTFTELQAKYGKIIGTTFKKIYLTKITEEEARRINSSTD